MMEFKINIRAVSCIFWTVFLLSCNNGPRVVEPKSEEEPGGAGPDVFQLDPSIQVKPTDNGSFGNDLHKVVVKEVLPTSRYMYLNVEEDKKYFWIATRKRDVSKGEMYFYHGGLLKTMFESKEYNKMFDTIYLVSNLVSSDHSKHMKTKGSPAMSIPSKTIEKKDIPTHTNKNVVHKGTVKISDLVSDPKKYEGHTIQISGRCVKINPNIMDRNWIHIQDGSQDDYDLVVTSNNYIPEGKEVTMRAEVSLNKDFGAGYTYDLILEDGILIE